MNENREADKPRSGLRWIWIAAAGVFAVVLLGLGGLILILMPLIYPEALPKNQMTQLVVEPPPPPPPQISSYQQTPANIIRENSSAQTSAHPTTLTLSSGVMHSLLIQQTIPIYPPIAKAARISGTVVLHAVISKTGSITELHLISGPAMLQQSALDAVKNWKYRPYQLNNQPVEVQTTINVIYTLGE